MNRLIITTALLLLGFCVDAQNFKLDNVNYKTITWTDFFKKLEKNPKLVYYDIRSDGERGDNGKHLAFNQGKIKGAIETDFGNFEKYYPEYLKHKNDTIYLYCSHSKRSRVLANQLADKGFANVVNINGGLSYLNTLSEDEMPYKKKYYVNNLKYKFVNSKDFMKAFNNEKYQIIDVRPDSLYTGTAEIERGNSFGNIKSVLHIPYDQLKDHLNLVDKNKSIYLFDNEGEQSPIGANYLIEKGYDTSVLLFGLRNIIDSNTSTKRKFLKTKYQFLLPEELLKIKDQKNSVIIDIRNEAEFNDTDKLAWKNIGRIKNAINIPFDTLSEDKAANYRGKTVILYDMMMFDNDLFSYAKRLKEYGITELYLIDGGMAKLNEEVYEYHKSELTSLIDQSN